MDLQMALYDIKQTEHRRHRSDFVYRGVDDADWGLDTSLQRLGPHCGSVEGPLLRNFLKYAGPRDIPSDALFFKLALAQHHGLPTRVLDWTSAPKVAVHFATSSEDRFDKDGAIWCVDVVAARSLLPAALRSILHDESAFLFSVEMLSGFRALRQFDALATNDPFVLFFEPPSLDGRIINQGAILSIMPGPTFNLRDLLQQAHHQSLYKRIIIPKEIKWEIRDKLDQDNVTERMLFPGLDGTARWLKRYYGSGPGAKVPTT
jgi:hypothetical protein